MIARIEGTLESVEDDTALVRLASGITYEVLLPAQTAARLALSAGEPVTLHTRHFIEGGATGSTMIPRLAGFTTTEDRRFFDLFTTCRGIGQRKALRAMAMDTGTLAAASSDKDSATLKSLPEIGQRTADTIIATLRGKLDELVSATRYPAGESGGAGEAPGGAIARQTLEALLQLGESRQDAVGWIDQAMNDPEAPPESTDDLLERVYRIKAGGNL